MSKIYEAIIINFKRNKGEPALKIRAGEMVKFRGEIIVNSGSSSQEPNSKEIGLVREIK